MKTTSTIVLATAALTGLALFLWNRMANKQATTELDEGRPMERSRHRNPVFSRLKQQVQENV